MRATKTQMPVIAPIQTPEAIKEALKATPLKVVAGEPPKPAITTIVVNGKAYTVVNGKVKIDSVEYTVLNKEDLKRREKEGNLDLNDNYILDSSCESAGNVRCTGKLMVLSKDFDAKSITANKGIYAEGKLTSESDITSAEGSITAKGSIHSSGGSIHARKDIIAEIIHSGQDIISTDGRINGKLSVATGPVGGKISAKGDITSKYIYSSGDITSDDGSITARKDMYSGGSISARGDISCLKPSLKKDDGMYAGKNITSREGKIYCKTTVWAYFGEISAKNGITAGRNIIAEGDITSSDGKISALTEIWSMKGKISARGDVTAHIITADGDVISEEGVIKYIVANSRHGVVRDKSGVHKYPQSPKPPADFEYRMKKIARDAEEHKEKTKKRREEMERQIDEYRRRFEESVGRSFGGSGVGKKAA